MSKLTKAQQGFYAQFARQAVENILRPVLEFRGVEINDEQFAAVVDTIDLTDLTTQIGTSFNERVDFATMKRVDKFIRSDDYIKVMTALNEVNALVQSTLIEVVAPLIPLTDEEMELKAQLAAEREAAELADQAS